MTTPRKDAAMSATATVHPDGSGTLILDGTEPQHLPAAEVAATRAALMALIQQQAATAGQSIAVVAAEPAGTWRLRVAPDGTIAPDDEEQSPPPSPAPTPSPVVEESTTPAKAAQPPSELGAPAMTRREARERSFLTHTRPETPAAEGWRGVLARLGISIQPSPAETARRDDVRAVSRHWPGPRTIAIVNGKGGANKTPSTAMLSAVFARHGGGGVLAWDNNDTRGTLGWRTEQAEHTAHIRDLLPHVDRLMDPAARAADIAAYVHHQGEDKYDVLRSNPASLPGDQRLTEADFDAVHTVASRYFRLIFIDSGNAEDAPHWLRMIDHADQVVVATTTRAEHAEAARLLLNALHDRDERSAGLADGAVVIVSQADRDEKPAAEVAEHYRGLARAAVTIPYDKAMRADLLRYEALSPETQRAWLRAGAAVAAGL
jgi:MinD-like ATPase involved in chromosome partitioning or flagellar assembly